MNFLTDLKEPAMEENFPVVGLDLIHQVLKRQKINKNSRIYTFAKETHSTEGHVSYNTYVPLYDDRHLHTTRNLVIQNETLYVNEFIKPYVSSIIKIKNNFEADLEPINSYHRSIIQAVPEKLDSPVVDIPKVQITIEELVDNIFESENPKEIINDIRETPVLPYKPLYPNKAIVVTNNGKYSEDFLFPKIILSNKCIVAITITLTKKIDVSPKEIYNVYCTRLTEVDHRTLSVIDFLIEEGKYTIGNDLLNIYRVIKFVIERDPRYLAYIEPKLKTKEICALAINKNYKMITHIGMEHYNRDFLREFLFKYPEMYYYVNLAINREMVELLLEFPYVHVEYFPPYLMQTEDYKKCIRTRKVFLQSIPVYHLDIDMILLYIRFQEFYVTIESLNYIYTNYNLSFMNDKRNIRDITELFLERFGNCNLQNVWNYIPKIVREAINDAQKLTMLLGVFDHASSLCRIPIDVHINIFEIMEENKKTEEFRQMGNLYMTYKINNTAKVNHDMTDFFSCPRVLLCSREKLNGRQELNIERFCLDVPNGFYIPVEETRTFAFGVENSLQLLSRMHSEINNDLWYIHYFTNNMARYLKEKRRISFTNLVKNKMGVLRLTPEQVEYHKSNLPEDYIQKINSTFKVRNTAPRTSERSGVIKNFGNNLISRKKDLDKKINTAWYFLNTVEYQKKKYFEYIAN